MQIAKHKVVTIDYTLTDGKGTVLNSSNGSEPFTYIQGIGNILPGLETALEGKSSGDAFSVRLPPEEGYGPRHESLIQVVSKGLFEDVGELQPGMQFEAQTNAGKRLLTIVRIEGNEVTIDGNHPLAGETLNFDVKVREVRDATDEELSHSHAHGPDTDH
ncbi:MAG: peptidylprolyl isomerase [Nitrospirae bacterium]|nr:peptidylprolyl isomerase [Nitrospirota bacterium]